jgi:hypothetical protein
MIPAFTRDMEIVKTTERGIMDRPGRWRGRIDDALYRTNITTVKGARRYEFTIRGRDARDKETRIKGSMDLTTTKQRKMASGLLVRAILAALHRRNLRTEYPQRGIRWADTHEPKSRALRRRPLHDVAITVRVLT